MRRRSTVASKEKAARALELDREALCSAGAPRDHPYLQPPPSRDEHLEEPRLADPCCTMHSCASEVNEAEAPSLPRGPRASIFRVGALYDSILSFLPGLSRKLSTVVCSDYRL